MKNILIAFAAAVLLAACATDAEMSAAEADDRAACRRADAPTGSNLKRRDECAPHRAAATPAETKKN